MSFRINTNVNAMNALRNLSMTGLEASKATTRLSTGLRINSGADDPSGLIASESYRAQLGGIDQALRNNQDAINFSKTAEGGLDEVNRLLRDARALAVANGNGTLDESQKQANQTQLNSILSSIDRIASTTSFGSKKMLDGSTGTQTSVINGTAIASASFHSKIGTASISSADDLDVNVTQAATRATLTSKTVATGATAVGAGTFSINGKSFTTDATTTRDQLVEKINAAAGETGVQATINGAGDAIVLTASTWGTSGDFELVDANGVIRNGGAGVSSTSAADAQATVTYTVGSNTYTSTFNSGKGLELKDNDGNSIRLTSAGNAVANLASAVRVNPGAASFQVGGNAGQTANLSIGNFSSSSLGLSGASVNITGTDMSTALAAIDSAIGEVAASRGRIGSFMKNTLESNVRALGIARENLAATESSIREIDVAEEMTNYTKLQILQQSGLSMLAQANQSPQAVLSLLR